jgi:hypothetical protein
MLLARQAEPFGRLAAELPELADPVSQIGKRLIFDVRQGAVIVRHGSSSRFWLLIYIVLRYICDGNEAVNRTLDACS